jgi:hypothetical protein
MISNFRLMLPVGISIAHSRAAAQTVGPLRGLERAGYLCWNLTEMPSGERVGVESRP